MNVCGGWNFDENLNLIVLTNWCWGSRPVLIWTFPCLGLELHVHVYMYNVYGTFICVPDLDIGTSGLGPNTDINKCKCSMPY